MSRLNGPELRSLLELLAMALSRREGTALLEAAAEQWRRGRLAGAAREAARAVREGEPLSAALVDRLPEPMLAALRAGELRGDPVGGLCLAAKAAGRLSLVGSRVLAPVAHPLSILIASVLAAALLGAVAAPPIQELRVELAHLEGRPAPGGLLAFAAERPRVAVAASLSIALLPLLMPVMLAVAGRSLLGSHLLLRLPVIGSILRWRAVADFGEAFADLLAAGLPHERAWSSALEAVGPLALRSRLASSSMRACSGEPLHHSLRDVGFPKAAVHFLRPELLREDGGVAALRELAHRATEVHEELLTSAGRALSAGVGVAGLFAAAGLLAAVLLPLFAAGGA